MEKKWWQEAVIYEIYCKSFCDSNGDGIGDLGGVLQKLPMLKELGINCIWFTPIYKSPMVDNGYDVADYYDIDPDYGTLADFKAVLDKAHSLGIRVIMDQVLNHSSDECPWFQESRKSKNNPYRDFYHWHAPVDGREPNNWGNRFREGNGSAWEFDELTGEYYLHQYSKKMPDLNWECPALRQEIYKMLRFWLDMGVDGFRLDIFTRLKKPEGYPDNTIEPNPILDRNGFVLDGAMCTCTPGIHEILHDIYVNVFGPYDCYTVGEGSGITAQNGPEYISPSRQELSMCYHFNLAARKKPVFDHAQFRRVQGEWAAAALEHDIWPSQFMSNHDSPRQVSRYGNDGEHRVKAAKLLGTLIHTTPGTPFMYQGEEIGMVNVQFDAIEDYNCCYTVGDYHSMVINGVEPAEALKVLGPKSRDNARTPYQWDGTENAGFTAGKPWLKVNPRYREINLEADRRSPDSVFAYYQKLIAMRREHPAILDGLLEFYLEEDPQLLVYTRKCARQTLLIVANKSDEAAPFALPEALQGHRWKVELANFEGADATQAVWQPWQCAVFSLAY